MTRSDTDPRAGFTLIEALVALSLLLAFASALGPLMSQGRNILMRGDGQVRAELFLRSLMEQPFARPDPELGLRQGETAGLRWQIDVEPFFTDALSFDAPPPANKKVNWALYKVTARVRSGTGQIMTAETLRLGDAGK